MFVVALRCFEPMAVSREFYIILLLTSSIRDLKRKIASTHLRERVQKQVSDTAERVFFYDLERLTGYNPVKALF